MLITGARQFSLSVQGSAGTNQVSHWDNFRENVEYAFAADNQRWDVNLG